MERSKAPAGALIGFLSGALAGAGIVRLSGTDNLRGGIIFMLVSALLCTMAGWVIGMLLKEKKPENTIPNTGQPLEITYDPEALETLLPTSTQTYTVDSFRLLGLTGLFGFLGACFLYFLSQSEKSIVFAIFAILFLGVALFYFINWLVNSSLMVRVSPSGLEYTSNRQRQFIEWSSIEKVWETRIFESHGFVIRNIHILRIITQDKREITIDRRLRRFSSLAQTINAAVTPCQLPGIVETLNEDSFVDFAEFQLSKQGIYSNGSFLAWHEVEQIIVSNGRVQIRKTGKNWMSWAETQAWEIANFPVFVKIASLFTTVKLR